MVKSENYIPQLGDGIYSAQDVAEILGLPYHKVRHAMSGFWNDFTFGTKGEKAVNFLTMIEFYTFYQLREKGVTASKIKKAHEVVSIFYGTSHPFALNIFKSDGKKVWYDVIGSLVSADGTQQIDIEPLLKPFLSKIEWDKTGMAERFYPLKGSKNIVVDPEKQFGQPVIAGTRIKSEVIANFYEAGESIKQIASLYELTSRQINDAIRFHKSAA